MWRAGMPTELELGLREVRRRKTVIRGGSGRSVVAGRGPCAAANARVGRRCGADHPPPSPPRLQTTTPRASEQEAPSGQTTG